MLLHGWPDDVRGWRAVAARLQGLGYRTFTPYLRGCGPTRFRSADALRDGRGVALAQDAIDFADALGLKTFAVAGHDWGARAAFTLAALFPNRVTHIVAVALAYQPRGEFKLPPFSQARRFWYQWYLTLDQRAGAVRADPKGFARIQWDTWSPPGWFDDAEFEATARSFENPDWVSVTLHAYRSRWRAEPTDPRYDALQRRLNSTETLATPTLMIQGGAMLATNRHPPRGWSIISPQAIGGWCCRESDTSRRAKRRRKLPTPFIGTWGAADQIRGRQGRADYRPRESAAAWRNAQLLLPRSSVMCRPSKWILRGRVRIA